MLILAEHYGFTEKEPGFTINFDIKYRMECGHARRGGPMCPPEQKPRYGRTHGSARTPSIPPPARGGKKFDG